MRYPAEFKCVMTVPKSENMILSVKKLLDSTSFREQTTLMFLAQTIHLRSNQRAPSNKTSDEELVLTNTDTPEPELELTAELSDPNTILLDSQTGLPINEISWRKEVHSMSRIIAQLICDGNAANALKTLQESGGEILKETREALLKRMF